MAKQAYDDAWACLQRAQSQLAQVEAALLRRAGEQWVAEHDPDTLKAYRRAQEALQKAQEARNERGVYVAKVALQKPTQDYMTAVLNAPVSSANGTGH